jgi:hypothetical protein
MVESHNLGGEDPPAPLIENPDWNQKLKLCRLRDRDRTKIKFHRDRTGTRIKIFTGP